MVFLIVGIFLVVFSKAFAKESIKDQNRFWGFSFSEKCIKPTAILNVIVGISFIVVAILGLLGVIKFKG